MRKTLVFVAVLALLVLAGCAQRAMPAAAPASTDQAVNAVGSDVKDLDSLNQDMDSSDLNSLDQELHDVDTLELQ